MRLAIIDLGTNSVRFDIHEIEAGLPPKQLHREKLMVRLGEGVFLSKKLDNGAVRRTLTAFHSFWETATKLHVDKYVAVGTSALREATDAEQFTAMVKKRTGIEVRVISGEEESRLIARGVLRNESKLPESFALVDIGGGSTEIIICTEGKVLHSVSVDLGAQRIQQVFLKTVPPKGRANDTKSHLELARDHIRKTLQQAYRGRDIPKLSQVIGSSGTVKALVKIHETQGKNRGPLSRDDLDDLVTAMEPMSKEELYSLPGLEPKRVDIILAGTLLLSEILRCLGAKTVRPTKFSLRDGILDEESSRLRKKKSSSETSILESRQLEDAARKLGVSRSRVQQLCTLSDDLFQKLRHVHGLKSSWKGYLTAAILFREVGTTISPALYDQHSGYIVKHTDLLRMESWERDFVAHLLARHNGTKPKPKRLPYEPDTERGEAFLKLLAMLRLMSAFTRGENGLPSIERIRSGKDSVKMFVSKKASHIAMLRAEGRKDLFESVFRRTLMLRN